MKKIWLFIFIGLLVSCKNETSNKEPVTSKETEASSVKQQQKDYKKIGLEIAFGTKKQLGKNLMGQLAKSGTLDALTFCNVKAIPLTDSMQTVYQAKIKRVSDKNRNPNNKANAEEIRYINQFKEMIKKGDKPQPIIKKKQDSVYFYYPIVTNEMCLQCHGKPDKNIKPKTLQLLSNLYPDDQATGYDENQVRGIWSIQIKK